MTYPIVVYGHTILRKVAEEINKDYAVGARARGMTNTEIMFLVDIGGLQVMVVLLELSSQFGYIREK